MKTGFQSQMENDKVKISKKSGFQSQMENDEVKIVDEVEKSIILLENAYKLGFIKKADFQKALDKSKLVKKQVIDKNGNITTKWVKTGQDEQKEPEKPKKEDVKKPQKKGDKFGNLSPESVKNLKKFRGEVIKNIEKISNFFDKEVGEIGFEDLIDAIGGFNPNYEKFDCRMNVYKDKITFEMECDGYRCEREFMKVKDKRGSGTKIVLHNELLKVSETGKGLGLEIMDSQIQKCKQLGVSKMTCWAAAGVMNGYYTWGRIGYTMTNDDDERFLHDLLEQNSMEKKSLPELLTTEKGREFWKGNGFPFEAEFDLSDNSTSMKIFNNYKKFKNAR